MGKNLRNVSRAREGYRDEYYAANRKRILQQQAKYRAQRRIDAGLPTEPGRGAPPRGVPPKQPPLEDVAEPKRERLSPARVIARLQSTERALLLREITPATAEWPLCLQILATLQREGRAHFNPQTDRWRLVR